MPLNFSKWEKLRLQWCVTKNWLYMHKLHNNAYQMKTRFLLTDGHRGGPAAQEMPYDGSSLSKGANSNRPAHYNAFCWDILPAKCINQCFTNQASWPATWIWKDKSWMRPLEIHDTLPSKQGKQERCQMNKTWMIWPWKRQSALEIV